MMGLFDHAPQMGGPVVKADFLAVVVHMIAIDLLQQMDRAEPGVQDKFFTTPKRPDCFQCLLKRRGRGKQAQIQFFGNGFPVGRGWFEPDYPPALALLDWLDLISCGPEKRIEGFRLKGCK